MELFDVVHDLDGIGSHEGTFCATEIPADAISGIGATAAAVAAACRRPQADNFVGSMLGSWCGRDWFPVLFRRTGLSRGPSLLLISPLPLGRDLSDGEAPWGNELADELDWRVGIVLHRLKGQNNWDYKSKWLRRWKTMFWKFLFFEHWTIFDRNAFRRIRSQDIILMNYWPNLFPRHFHQILSVNYYLKWCILIEFDNLNFEYWLDLM